MAKNKFSTMFCRNTNKITMGLIHAVVEWILILLLLFNNILSSFIIKYAEFFGAEPPCPLCTVKIRTDLLCQAHANQKENVGQSLKCCCCCGVGLGGILQVEERNGDLEEKETLIMKENSPQKLQFFLHWDDDDDDDGDDDGRVEDEGLKNRIIFDFDINLEMHLDDRTASSSEEVAEIDGCDENEADVSIGTEIPDVDNVEDQECVHSHSEKNDLGLVEFQPPFQLELNKIDDDWVPNTPASVESLNRFNRNSTFPDENDFSSEESMEDGTIERLKSALRAERKSLEAVYAELEEERSACAEAVNQALAMINRLQEEKAAMQMEAYQYRRMMEEQSEYDQQALQLMNEIMFEKEKELEVCKKKLLHYERREEMRVFTCTCVVNSEDIVRGGDHDSTCVVNSEDCLAYFEEERAFVLHEDISCVKTLK